MCDDLPREDVTAAVDRVVGDVLQRAGVGEPPVDAIAIAQRHLGIVVALDARQHQRGRAQRGSASGTAQIFLRPEPTEERHQWTVAHEIGEHLKPTLLRTLGVGPDETFPMSGESLANLFAYRFLVPTCWFAGDAAEFDYDLARLKERYRTSSHEVLAGRLLDLPEPCIITILDNDRIYRRRSNAWRVRRQLSAVEHDCQRQVNQTGVAAVLDRAGWTVQGWPVHQADWKREVLRSVVDEETGGSSLDATAGAPVADEWFG